MRIPNKLPGNLSIRGGESQLFGNQRNSYNYAIGGIPFLSAASDTSYGNWWIKRETAPFRKQQFDNAQNPGEQSLEGYWIRSVMSFHGGAGQLYADPVEGNTSSDIRYWKSRNVSVWTPGALSLLQAPERFTSTGAQPFNELISIISGTTKAAVGIQPTKVWRIYRDNTNVLRSVSDTPAGVGTILSVSTDGANIFIATTSGVWKSPNPAVITTPLTFTQIYAATLVKAKLAWAKDRLILGSGQSIYELSPNPATPPAALPTALYTAKASGWVWTDITETTGAIYAVGNAVAISAVLKFTLDASGDLPTLTGGTIACQLPGGETAISALGYLGTFLAIGTSRGVRVAIADDQGNLTYGPLLWDNGGPVYDFAARDHWIWCTYKDASDTQIKCARIDLGLQLEPLTFAWSTDLCTDLETFTDVADCIHIAFLGDSPLLAFSTQTNTWVEDPRRLQANGYLETSRIRFNTLEPKIFRGVRVRGPLLTGSLHVAYVTATGSITPVYTYGNGQLPGSDDLKLSGTVRDFLSLQFTLSRNLTDISTGAQMFGWQVKALPGSPRQRLITLPLYCFDYEEDKHGVKVGGQGSAIARLFQLESLEASGNITTFQDLDNNTAQDVFIENVEFQQGSPPAHYRQPGSTGGRILLTMRTV
jgi:hypothetical protein